ncbi:hypothetical protein ABZS68_29265, partial [Streptomyces sp. NPDC005571]
FFGTWAEAPVPRIFGPWGPLYYLGDWWWGGRGPPAPHTADVWVAASLNQCDGDAPMIIVALVSDRPIIELEDEQPTAFRLGRE